MIAQNQIDRHKVHQLLMHLGQAIQTKEERDAAKNELMTQIEHMRISFGKDSKNHALGLAIKELQEKMEEALDKQTKTVTHVFDQGNYNDELLTRMTTLEKQLAVYLGALDDREKRIKELESRIRDRNKVKHKKSMERPAVIMKAKKTIKKPTTRPKKIVAEPKIAEKTKKNAVPAVKKEFIEQAQPVKKKHHREHRPAKAEAAENIDAKSSRHPKQIMRQTIKPSVESTTKITVSKSLTAPEKTSKDLLPLQ